MKPVKFTFAIITTLQVSSLLWSCNTDKTSAGPTGTQSAQDETAIPTTTDDAGETMDLFRPGCPMTLPGAEVAVSNTEGGVALTFTADNGMVADLRTRVGHLTRMYGMHNGTAGMMWNHMGGKGMGHKGGGMGGEGLDHMNRRSPMPAVTGTMTVMNLGARIVLRPNDASKLEALREHVRWHQQRMHYGECWILQGHSIVPSHEEQE